MKNRKLENESSGPKTSPINIVVYCFTGKCTIEIVQEIKKNNFFNLVAWFGVAPECTHNLWRFYEYKNDFDINQKIPTDVFVTLQKELFNFIDIMTHRHKVPNHARKVPVDQSFLQEDLDQYHRYIYHFWKLLTENPVNLVLIDTFPHTGPDLILFHLAKYLGIKTLMLYPTPFSNKFMYFSDFPNNCSDFQVYYDDSQRPQISAVEKYILKIPEEPNYMKNYPVEPQKKLGSGGILSAIREIWKEFKTKDPIRPGDYLFPTLIRDLKKDFRKVLKDPSLQLLLTKIALVEKYVRVKAYRQALIAYSTGEFSLGEKYVYFPLHFQPEQTTHSMSRQIYLNQILAIEKLSVLIPKDWIIYIKDHPAQSERCRAITFFQRISGIKKVRLLSRGASSFSLIQNAQFVATISGTVGWEALQMSKKVLLFGSIYYQGLPGVFTYNDSLKLEDILSYSPNLSDLETAVANLIARLETGVTNYYFADQVENFDVTQNARTIVSFLMKQMRIDSSASGGA
jgi:hypothetical protein